MPVLFRPQPPSRRGRAANLVFLPALACAAVASPSAAAAQAAEGEGEPERAATLGAILETAVRQSPALELARIDVAIAEARALQAAGIDDWLLAATARYFGTRIEPVEGSFFTQTASDTASFDVDLSRSLPWGGTFGLHGNGQISQSTTAVEANPGQFEERDSEAVRASVVARLDQPLLEGRGYAVARADRRLAEVEVDAAQLAAEADATSVVRDLILAYWELGYARSDLEIRESSLELAREQLRITEAAVEAGAVAQSELLAVQQVIATRQEDVAQARLGVTRDAIELRRLAGMPVGPGHIAVAATAPVEIEEVELSLEDLVARARAQSPEIAVLRTRGEGAEIEVEVTENGLLPRLDASVSFGPTGSSSSISDTISQIGGLDGYEVGGSLTYEHALGRRAAKGAHAAAKGRLARSTIDIAEAELQVSAAVVDAASVAETAAIRLELGQRAIELAEQNVEAELARFELGRATNFDVLERQEELEQARLRYARAGVDYLAALAQLQALTGELLERYGITIGAR